MIRLTGRGAELLRVIRKRSHADGESGAYAVMTALLLTLLCGLTALGVDYSNARMIQTKAQNSADAAVLAGAQDLPNEPAVTASVKDYAFDNFGIAPNSWANCVDALALEELVDIDQTNGCISTDAAHTRLRVALPTTRIDTWFGKAIGVDHAVIKAAAEAEVVLYRDNRIIPATVTSTAGTGNMCIENSGANTPCVGASSGNFGSLISPRLHIHTTDNDADALTINYAMGIDHNLAIYGAGHAKICDGDQVTPCSFSTDSNATLTPNHLNTNTGNRVNEVTDGLVLGRTVTTQDGGVTRFCGRLQRPNLTDDNIAQAMPSEGCVPDPPTVSVIGQVINGHHIASRMTPAARSAFYPELGSSNPAIGNIIYVSGDARLDCYLRGFRASRPLPDCSSAGLAVSPPAPIFMGDILYDPRFGKIPIVCTEGRRRDGTCVGVMPNGGSVASRLVGFWGVFLNQLAINGGDNTVHGVSAWVYDLSLITQDANQNLEYGVQSTPVVHLAK